MSDADELLEAFAVDALGHEGRPPTPQAMRVVRHEGIHWRGCPRNGHQRHGRHVAPDEARPRLLGDALPVMLETHLAITGRRSRQYPAQVLVAAESTDRVTVDRQPALAPPHHDTLTRHWYPPAAPERLETGALFVGPRHQLAEVDLARIRQHKAELLALVAYVEGIR